MPLHYLQQAKRKQLRNVKGSKIKEATYFPMYHSGGKKKTKKVKKGGKKQLNATNALKKIIREDGTELTLDQLAKRYPNAN